MTHYKYAICIAAELQTMSYLFQVPIPAPLNLYKPSSKIQRLGNGGIRHAGWPIDLWSWASLEAAERSYFRTICPGAYADDIYIATLNDNNAWVLARTKMFWPMEGEDFSNDNTLGFQLIFKVKAAEALT